MPGSAVGYFVTKQPSSEELEEGVGFQMARVRESQFFHNVAPWCDQKDSSHRYGTANLTKELSKQLGELISKVCVIRKDYF